MSDEPILYILMRTDMASLTPGKACAQAAHAANLFVERARLITGDYDFEMWKVWKGSQGFGTTIVLAVRDEQELRAISKKADEIACRTWLVLDPTYPLQDGNCKHEIPVVTCGYVFGPRNVLEPILGYLGLY